MDHDPLDPITDNTRLAAFIDALAPSDFLCVDTEFHRETTYWPELCLVQLSAPGVEGLVDPLAKGIDLAPLWELLLDESRIKVLHAARQDMEIFTKLAGKPPGPVFDTQLAAMALGLGDSISYDKMVAAVTGAAIDKGSQFTDWAQRPLSATQLTYALGDVTHLRDVYLDMEKRLDKLDRWDWIEDDMDALEDISLYRVAPEDAWKRLKLRKTTPEYTAVAAAVAAWREARAQKLDKPRRRLLKDDAITEIAQARPLTQEAFDKLRAVPKGFIRSRNAAGLLDAVAAAVEDPEAHAPPLPPRKRNAPLPAGAPEILKVLLKHVADEANVVPRLIANSADIDRIARGDLDGVPAMQGWREKVFGAQARALLEGKLALSFEKGKIRLFEV